MFCKFCNREIALGTGLIYAEKEGKQFAFCSKKCRHNLLVLGREGRLHKWTAKGEVLRSEKKAEEKKDSVLSKEIDEKLAAKKAAAPAKK